MNVLKYSNEVFVTLQGLEPLQGDSGGPRDELQQPGSPLFVKRLHGFPEPLHDVAVQRAVLQTCVGPPVSDVDLTQTANYQLRGEERRGRLLY